MKKNPLIFTIHTVNGREYSNAYITIHEPESWNKESHKELLQLEWQSGADERGRWYGLTVKTDNHDHAGDIAGRLKRAAKLMEQLFPSGEYPAEDPRSLVERLSALGIARAAYDGRVSRYVREVEAIDPALRCWLDDRPRYDAEASSTSGCMVKGLADGMENAQKMLEKEWLAGIAKGYARAEQFAAWVSAGRPVREAYYDKAANYAPIGELLHEAAPVAEAIAA